VHHKSTNPSPWTAYAFHPYEAVLEAIFIYIIVLLLPYHILTLVTFLIFMMCYNVYGHLGYELYPKNFHKTAFGKWMNTAVTHNQHHKNFNGNYGLYFLFWDRIMGTVREDYDDAYVDATTRKKETN
jgi:sterol desaturase/sphingolipid hydroxylase (fatty acid hydroxylase superfamily)